jgi:hypothetical protein
MFSNTEQKSTLIPLYQLDRNELAVILTQTDTVLASLKEQQEQQKKAHTEALSETRLTVATQGIMRIAAKYQGRVDGELYNNFIQQMSTNPNPEICRGFLDRLIETQESSLRLACHSYLLSARMAGAGLFGGAVGGGLAYLGMIYFGAIPICVIGGTVAGALCGYVAGFSCARDAREEYAEVRRERKLLLQFFCDIAEIEALMRVFDDPTTLLQKATKRELLVDGEIKKQQEFHRLVKAELTNKLEEGPKAQVMADDLRPKLTMTRETK